MILTNITAGVASGFLCACGGAWKDSPHEGFKPSTFMRSIVVGAATGAITALFTKSFVIAFFTSGYMERCVVEGWKIVRGKVPGKFAYLPK